MKFLTSNEEKILKLYEIEFVLSKMLFLLLDDSNQIKGVAADPDRLEE